MGTDIHFVGGDRLWLSQSAKDVADKLENAGDAFVLFEVKPSAGGWKPVWLSAANVAYIEPDAETVRRVRESGPHSA